jgi:DNA-binding Lrp family transcriptional regulator
MKDVELKLLCELMKDSRRSDRELAKAVGVSQPTATRTRGKLEKEGYIKEYTIIPDFRKLGYNVMGVTLLKHNEPVNEERSAELRKAVIETEKQNPHASLMAVSGMGLQKNRLFITALRRLLRLLACYAASEGNSPHCRGKPGEFPRGPQR